MLDLIKAGTGQSESKYLQTTYLAEVFYQRICTQLSKLISKQRNDPIRKWAKHRNRPFIKEEIDTKLSTWKNCQHISYWGNEN